MEGGEARAVRECEHVHKSEGWPAATVDVHCSAKTKNTRRASAAGKPNVGSPGLAALEADGVIGDTLFD